MWLSEMGGCPEEGWPCGTRCFGGHTLWFRAITVLGRQVKIDLIHQFTSSCRTVENMDSSIGVKFLKFLKTTQCHWHLLCSPCKCHHHGDRHTGKGLGSRKSHQNQTPVGILSTLHSQREQNLNLCIQVVLISCWRLLDGADTWEQGTALYLILGVFSIKGNKMLKASERIKIRFYRIRALHLPGGIS